MPNGIWLKTGQDWLGRINECVVDCGNALISVGHTESYLFDCILEFCMAAELWLWRRKE